MTPDLAYHASEKFNRELWASVVSVGKDVQAALQEDLIALVLGGGYGRGEGAVWRESDGTERPYNDLDFTLVTYGRSRGTSSKLKEISQIHTRRTGIDIDFSRPLTMGALRKLPHTMMWHDLLNGHTSVYGPTLILDENCPHYLREPLPAVEGVRLLLNRGAGLLMAMRQSLGVEKGHDSDFCRRNLYKAKLALGDAILISAGRYTTHCRGRDAILAETLDELSFSFAQKLLNEYGQALQFKFEPASLPLGPPTLVELEETARTWQRVFLYTESRRMGRSFNSAQEYFSWNGLREKSQSRVGRWPKNIVLNLRLGHVSSRYPRERLYRHLLVLLGPGNYEDLTFKCRSEKFLSAWQMVN